MEKLDLKKKYKHLYLPSAKEVVLVEVPEFQFVMVDGEIEPDIDVADSVDYRNALEALYGVSYGLKFASKLREENPIDYTVMALEGLWWTATSHEGFELSRSEPWYFTAMMMQPEHISEAMFQQAVADLKEKKDNPAIGKLRFERFEEGLCTQIMHLGPYSEEPATIAKMDAFAEEHGYKMRGRHHEIYIGDPRRAKPENLRTVLRHPVEKVG